MWCLVALCVYPSSPADKCRDIAKSFGMSISRTEQSDSVFRPERGGRRVAIVYSRIGPWQEVY